MISRFSNKQVAILHALGVYKFLTYEQMLGMGIDKYQSNLSKEMSELVEAKYVYKLHPTVGVKAIYMLTKRGGEWVSDTYEFDAHYVRSKARTIPNEMLHRLQVIDFHISISHYELVFCHRYFDSSGIKGVRKTRIGDIEPDMNFSIKTKKQVEYYLLEIENNNNFQKAYGALIAHKELMLSGEVQRKYSFDYGYRTLYIVTDENLKENLTKKALESGAFQNLTENFLFYHEQLQQWYNLSGKERKLFYE